MVLALDDIVGQAVPVAILQRGLQTDTLAHAYLFSGPAGLGKETTARAVARELKRRGGEYSELYVLDGAGSIGVDEIRALRKKATFASAGNLIWIVKDAERMTVPACSAFLKILEEPRPGTYFFLTTTNIHSLLPTVVSRCQHLPFRSIGEEEIMTWLAQRSGFDVQALPIRRIARLARGSLGKAWEYWEGGLGQYRGEILEKLIKLPTLSYPEVLGLSQNWPEDRERIALDLQLMLEWHRDLLTVKGEPGLSLYNPDYEQELRRISAFYSYSSLFQIIKGIGEMRVAIGGNARIRFCLGYLLLSMKKGALT